MENMQSYWKLGDELRGQSKVSEDQKWYSAASRLAEQTRSKGERRNNLDLSKMPVNPRPRDNVRIRIRKVCKALEEDAFRPVLHHYDGPKFRLELSIPEHNLKR
ncbi:hypothetical protein Hanom_Chr01g00075931 [Helianthus anomalus]